MLVPAYDDAAGVTAAFNLNLLDRINRELGGDIPVDAFVHRAIWNDAFARIEMHLEAKGDVDFTIDGRAFTMTAGETIHTENSHKYGARDASLLLRAGGWTPIAKLVRRARLVQPDFGGGYRISAPPLAAQGRGSVAGKIGALLPANRTSTMKTSG